MTDNSTDTLQELDEPEELLPAELPLGDWHRQQGARMVEFAGYMMPIQYEGIMAEHRWTRDHAGLFDVSHMGQVLLTGEAPDAALETVVPGDILKLAENRLRYTLLLSPEGGILDDLMVTRRAEDLYMVVNGATKWDDLAYLREMLPDNVTINHLEEHALLALQGPEAGAALASLIPAVDGLYFMQAGAFTLDGMDLWISRSGYTGEDGFEISVAAEHVETLADRLLALDAVKPIGLGARDSLRLEAGLPLYGHDLDPGTTPVSAALTFALGKRRREEGGFAGAGRILAELAEGSDLVRVGLDVEGRQPLRENARIIAEDGAVIGRVTSGGFAPSLERPIAMAYVPAALAEPGTAILAEQRGKRMNATVAAMPFVPARYRRPPKS